MNPRHFAVLLTVSLTVMALIVLAGCATEPVERLVEVKIPYAVPCNAPEVTMPEWPLDVLPADATLWEKVTSALAEIDLRIAYERELNAALDACRE